MRWFEIVLPRRVRRSAGLPSAGSSWLHVDLATVIFLSRVPKHPAEVDQSAVMPHPPPRRQARHWGRDWPADAVPRADREPLQGRRLAGLVLAGRSPATF